jgi:hypothetical protein
LLSPQGTGFSGYYDAVKRLPDVETAATGVGIQGFLNGINGPGVLLLATADTLGVVVERPRVVAGRLPRPDRVDEGLADRNLTRALHVHVGSELHITVAPTDENGPVLAKARTVTIRVVGLGIGRDNVVSVNALASAPTLLTAPALLRQFDPSYYSFDGLFVRLRPGASRTAFARQSQALVSHFPDTTGSEVLVADEHALAAKVEHAIRPQAAALAIFSLLAAITALFVLGQIVSRQLFVAATENPTLRALGMSRGQLVVLGLLEVGAVAVAGAVVAVVVAIAASPVMPIGPARIADPNPGLSADWAVLGVGGLAIVALLAAREAWAVFRLASAPAGVQGTAEAAGADRPSRVLQGVTRAGAPATVSIGVRLALEPGRGRTAVPVRSALAGTVLAIAAVAAAFTFGTNLVRLVDTPRLYGQTWDLGVDTQFGQINPADGAALISKQPGVAGWTWGDHLNLAVDGRPLPAIGMAPGRGATAWPTLIEGRPPRSPEEIVVGTKTLYDLHRRVGQTVSATLYGSDQPVPLRIVGRAVFPFFGQGSFAPTGLGEGAALIDPAPQPGGFNFVVMRLRPGADRAAAVARFERALAEAKACPGDQVCGVSAAQRPVDITNYARIRGTPLALAAVLGALAVATIAHLLVTSTRRRRRDLAVLKTLGFVRRQVSAAVAWQATTLVALALLIGIPLGVAGGRAIWQFFASRLGVAPDPRVPLLTLALTVPVALAVANVLAAGPGWVAGRLKPAPVLRTE